MVLENEIYIISKTSIKTAKTNNNFIQDKDYTRITTKKEFKDKAKELINFIEDKNNKFKTDNTEIIKKIYNDSLDGSDYVFIVIEKKNIILYKINDISHGHEINYETVIVKDSNKFLNFLIAAIQYLDDNFETKKNKIIQQRNQSHERDYKLLKEPINKTKTGLEEIHINRLNNKDILNDFNKLKTDISKDIEEAIKKINNIKKKEDTNFLEKITNEVNEELGLE